MIRVGKFAQDHGTVLAAAELVHRCSEKLGGGALGPGGDAKTDFYRELSLPLVVVEPFQFMGNTPRDPLTEFKVGIREDDRKIVAIDSCREVGSPYRSRNACGSPLDHGVARFSPMGFINHSRSDNVEHDERDMVNGGPGRCASFRESVVEQLSVVEASQVVDTRFLLQPADHRLAAAYRSSGADCRCDVACQPFWIFESATATVGIGRRNHAACRHAQDRHLRSFRAHPLQESGRFVVGEGSSNDRGMECSTLQQCARLFKVTRAADLEGGESLHCGVNARCILWVHRRKEDMDNSLCLEELGAICFKRHVGLSIGTRWPGLQW